MNRFGLCMLGGVLLSSIPAIYANDFSMGPTEKVDYRLDHVKRNDILNADPREKYVDIKSEHRKEMRRKMKK